jgi:long-chain acyl-CoA synthetase
MELFNKKPIWFKNYKDVPYSLKYPRITMYELIEETAKKYPNNIAYEYFGVTCTYSNFINKINKVASSLKSIGITSNDIVTICMPNTPEAIILFYAINLIGAVSNMVHPLSSEGEIEFYLNKTNSRYIFTIDISYEKIASIVSNTKLRKIVVIPPSQEMKPFKKLMYWFFKGRHIKIDDNNIVMNWNDFLSIGKNYKGIYRYKRKFNEIATILYSGGTTGKPKGIMLSNLNFNAVALQTRAMVDLKNPTDSILAIMPIFHGFGIGESIHAPLAAGMKCILIPNFNAKKFDELIKKHKPNFVIGVPTLFEALLKYGSFKDKDLSSISCIVSGGDIVSTELKRRVDELLEKYGSKAKLRVGYGLTEGTCASCLTTNDYFKNECIGIPFPDTYYKIVKIGTNDEVPINIDGEICISGPTVMMGYYDEANENMQTLRKHRDGKIWLHTGDVGCINEDGYVFFKQRIKRIIISSGYNIYPSYIENVINEHPDVLSSVVIGIDHPYKVQVAKAIIILKPEVKNKFESKRSIKEHCEKNIAKYSLPYEYEFRKSIPTTLVGKVSYGKLNEENNK